MRTKGGLYDNVWTGIDEDGEFMANDCFDWFWTLVHGNATGRSIYSDDLLGRWSASEFTNCVKLNRLYCFEQ